MWTLINYLGIGLVIFCLSACEAHRGASTSKPNPGTSTTAKTKVLIKDFAVKGIPEDGISGVSSKFCVEFSKCQKVELVCADDLRNILQHKQDLMAFGACQEDECLSQLGNLMEADYVIRGSIDKVGDVLTLNINLVAVKEEKSKQRFSREVPADKPEALLEAVTAIAGELVQAF